jgi:sugar transferase (PEP-CTERM system associated)
MARVFNHYFSPRKLFLFLLEEALLFGAAAIGATLAWPSSLKLSGVAALGLLFATAFQFSFYFGDLYDLRIAKLDRVRNARLLRSEGIAILVIALGVIFLLPGFPRGVVLGAVAGGLVGVLTSRSTMSWIMGPPMKVVILGGGQRARELARSIDLEGEGACSFVGFVTTPGETNAGTRANANSSGPESKAPVFTEGLAEVCRRTRADAVVVATEDRRGSLPIDALMQVKVSGLSVFNAASFSERVLRRLPLAQLRQSDLIFADDFELSRTRAFFKRLLDLLAAVTLAVLAAPVMLVVAALIRLDSEGPIFYRQERVGLSGKIFEITKFRTMRIDAEKNGAQWAQKNDPRITRVGRFLRVCRLDELPQLFAVLGGDMTLVGPRPERPVFVEQLKQQIPFYGLREAVKPGVTGWAQLRFPYGASVEDAKAKLEYDLYYIKNGSLFLDLAILFHTVRHVLLARGAR